MSGMEGWRNHGAARSSARIAASDVRRSARAPSTQRRRERVESQMLRTAKDAGKVEAEAEDDALVLP
ncbi:hypothetical protein GUJ93_ZPchr0004g40187 [Zizania palustris]|uniref:Uncharacterized protein n=1 Tax=Zizania palustris TaxID=103762 RepID=A0A8J5S645_ZIZPA|nr:hypothetical protein GUJ93_ZPchr0004g40187 [Zizania palustris]